MGAASESAIRTALVCIPLVLPFHATAADCVPVTLPAAEDPAAWADALALAGLCPTDGDASLQFAMLGDGWAVRVHTPGGVVAVPVAPPRTAEEREDLAMLAVSLSRAHVLARPATATASPRPNPPARAPTRRPAPSPEPRATEAGAVPEPTTRPTSETPPATELPPASKAPPPTKLPPASAAPPATELPPASKAPAASETPSPTELPPASAAPPPPAPAPPPPAPAQPPPAPAPTAPAPAPPAPEPPDVERVVTTPGNEPASARWQPWAAAGGSWHLRAGVASAVGLELAGGVARGPLRVEARAIGRGPAPLYGDATRVLVARDVFAGASWFVGELGVGLAGGASFRRYEEDGVAATSGVVPVVAANVSARVPLPGPLFVEPTVRAAADLRATDLHEDDVFLGRLPPLVVELAICVTLDPSGAGRALRD